MGQPHMQFDRAELPRQQRTNPHASAQFDWAKVLRECDGELKQATNGLGPEAKAELSAALMRLLSWVYAVDGYSNKANKSLRTDAAIGRRAIAMGLHACPTVVPIRTMAEAARMMGMRRQSLNQLVKKAQRRFPL